MKPPRTLPVDHPSKATSPVALKNHLDQISKTLSNISFGSSTPESNAIATPAAGQSAVIVDNDSNMEGNKFIIHFPVAPNTDITIQHDLGRIPVGWVPLRLTNQGVIYLGSVAPTATAITLRETQGSQVAILHFI